MKSLNQFLKNLFKVDGFIIVDANKKEYTIGKPLKNPHPELFIISQYYDINIYLTFSNITNLNFIIKFNILPLKINFG